MTTTPDITPALVEALRDAARRNEAFDRLTAAMLRPLYWHIRRLVVVHEDAQDACQECFVKAYDGLEAFRGGADELRAWLYRIATRAALTLLRRRRRSLFASLDEAGPDADRALVRLHEAVLELPLKQRLVFNLRYFDDLPYAAIARILGEREQTLKVNYHYAVEKLKTKLANHE